MDGAAGDMGKGRINIREKERGFSFLYLHSSGQTMGAEQKSRRREDFSSLLQLRWLYSFFLFFFTMFPVRTKDFLPVRRSAGDRT